jgi:hypothetical protein
MKTTQKKAKISLGFQKKSASETVSFGNGTVTGCTGNAFFPSMPVPLGTISAQCTAVENDLTKIASGNTSTALTKLLAQDLDALKTSLTTNGHYVEDTANTVAAGNLAKAQQMINSSGYKLKKTGTPHPRVFEVMKSGIQWVHLRVKSVGTRAGYVWRYAPVSAKGVVPTSWTYVIYTLETELVINNLKSSTIYAFQYASILPVSHSKKVPVLTPIVVKAATTLSSTKSSKPTYTDGQTQLQFSDTIYFTVQ